MLVVGVDAAFANFGLCLAHANGALLRPVELKLISTVGQDKKVVRKSSDDLRRAKELHDAFVGFSKQAAVVFAEVPSGSQSARSSWSLGIAVGVLASCPVPLIQVSQLEVKMATVGRKTASKDDMINWAIALYPNLNWIRHAGRVTNANEHLADAVATIHAGMKTDTYKQICAMIPAGSFPPTSKVRRVIYNGTLV